MGMDTPRSTPGGPREAARGCESSASVEIEGQSAATVAWAVKLPLPSDGSMTVVGVVSTLLWISSLQDGHAGMSSPQQDDGSLSTATVEYRAVPLQ